MYHMSVNTITGTWLVSCEEKETILI